MAQCKRSCATLALCGVALLAVVRPCEAHMLWTKRILIDNKPHAFLFFGESALDEAYHMPESLADSKVWLRAANGKRRELATKPLETFDRIGLVAPLGDDESCVLEASERYGVYGTALLSYAAKYAHANSAKELNTAGPSKELKLDIVPHVVADRLELAVLWNGEPLAGAKVSLRVGDDEEAIEKTTDEKGRVTFKPQGKGTVSILTSRMDESQSGELTGKPYDHSLQYTSLTIDWPAGIADGSTDPARDLTSLPEPLSSFGAAVAGGWLYVYGGHTGTEHEHSAANLSKHFRRVELDGAGEWEDLPMQLPLQGLAMVAHGGKVYRIGGMNARNATVDDEEDLHSTDEFAEFDPATNKWTVLTPLPAPRSSHNAVVIGDRLYVVGGWALAGSSPGEWQTDALVYNVADPGEGWQKLPKPPFRRRALAVSHWNGRLVALGGLDDEGEVSQRVDMFDPQSGQWMQGPELSGAGHAGFGVSAWNLYGRLYVSGLSGILYRLNDEGTAWEEVAQLDKPRFFHQLVPASNGGILAVGGASREGHIADIEWIDVRK